MLMVIFKERLTGWSRPTAVEPRFAGGRVLSDATFPRHSPGGLVGR